MGNCQEVTDTNFYLFLVHNRYGLRSQSLQRPRQKAWEPLDLYYPTGGVAA